MDPASERDVLRLFAEIRELPPRERAAFLETNCPASAVRDRVLDLLACDPQAATFLGTPVIPGLDEQAVPDLAQDLVGQQVGRYTIRAPIGSGGMGVVFLAEQERPRRVVALKVMRTAMASRAAVRRFEYEAEVLGRLQHPNIAQIHEASVHPGAGRMGALPFFAMEYVDGARPVTEHAETTALDDRARLALFVEVCRGVRHGHQKGVIHRDLKPANILVGASGEPKIIDFGVARAADREHAETLSHTGHGHVVGTVRYMSPEQCQGRDIDIRTDVYALGLVLYELICGRFPYDLTGVAELQVPRVIGERAPVRPRAVRPELAGDLEAIILKALEKDRERRYQSSADLARDIGRFLRSEPIEARPPSVLYQARLFARRHRALVGATVTVAVVLLAAVAVSVGFALAAQREAALRTAAERTAVEERDAAVYQAYVANIAAAESALRAGEYRRLRSRLHAAPPHRRGWEWRYLDRLAEPALAVIEHGAMIESVAVHPDGERMATGGRDGVIRIWSPSSGAPLDPTPAHDGWIFDLVFDDGGTRMLSAAIDGSLRLWTVGADADLRPERTFTLGHRLSRAALSGDGALVVASDEAGRVRAWDAETGAERWMVETGRDPRGLAVDPTGAVVAGGGAGGRIELWDAATGVSVGTLEGHETSVRAIAWGPAGRRLYSAASDQKILVWDVATRTSQREIDGHGATIWRLAVSRDGTRLASTSVDQTVRVWDPDRGVAVLELAGHGDAVVDVAWTDESNTRLVSASWDGTARVWRAAPPEIPSVVHDDAGTVYAIAADPTGRLLASTHRAGPVHLRDAVTLERLATFTTPKHVARALAFDGAGRRLAIGWTSGVIDLVDTRTGETIARLEHHEDRVYGLALAAEGCLVSGGRDDLALVWDLTADGGVVRHELRGHAGIVFAVAVSPDGTRAATASWDDTARLWDTRTGEEIAVLHGHEYDLYAIAFSPDGRTLVTGARDQTVRVWDGTTGAPRRTLGGHGQFVTGLAFSPDGTRLAASSWFSVLMLWDTETYAPLVSLGGHEAAVRCIAFDPRGARIVTGSSDASIRLWDDRAADEQRRVLRRLHAAEPAARRRVATLRDAGRLGQEAADAIEADPTLAPAERHAALNWLLRLGREDDGG